MLLRGVQPRLLKRLHAAIPVLATVLLLLVVLQRPDAAHSLGSLDVIRLLVARDASQNKVDVKFVVGLGVESVLIDNRQNLLGRAPVGRVIVEELQNTQVGAHAVALVANIVEKQCGTIVLNRDVLHDFPRGVQLIEHRRLKNVLASSCLLSVLVRVGSENSHAEFIAIVLLHKLLVVLGLGVVRHPQLVVARLLADAHQLNQTHSARNCDEKSRAERGKRAGPHKHAHLVEPIRQGLVEQVANVVKHP
mmetsp:Transcript_37539/g.71941  ORF Transcript_37539/g.71941 Transcript_37539/m.71941 type:complete len:249 (+) Transcript_37539:420-1166(+)